MSPPHYVLTVIMEENGIILWKMNHIVEDDISTLGSVQSILSGTGYTLYSVGFPVLALFVLKPFKVYIFTV